MKNTKNKMGFIKIAGFFVSLVLCANVICACNNGDSPGNPGNPEAELPDAPGGGTSETAQEPGLDIPVADMGGKEITLALLNWHLYEPLSIHDIEVEELTGDGFNDAAYNRNKYMEETFNCQVNTVAFPTQDSIPKIRNQITAGDDAYDIIFFRAITMLPLLTGGYLHDFGKIPYVDLDKPWWDKKSIEAMSIGGKVYSALGDYSMTVLSCVWLTYFNKEMLADFGLDDPYRLVREGKWTFDTMYDMGKTVAADLNGNGKRDMEDRYGFMHIDNTAAALFNGFGERLVDIGDDGLPYISLANPSAIEKFLHITEVLSDYDTFLNAHRRTPDAYTHEAGMFVWGRSLFSLGGVYYGPEMRAMEQNFGLLPYPKFNESQEWFNPIHSAAIPLVTVPITNGDFENMGLFIEAFTYQGHVGIRPQFYDVMLQRKVARDDESEEMLDFIFNNKVFDIGETYNFGDIYGQFNNLVCSGNINLASWLDKNTVKIERDIEAFVEAMKGN
ncbi:MAG: ABC transporter substrate-binding protein [Oscillospiraceae bacterium]|nr:ABC transporter substrate-binding protein [Oscillospiraceae bacterium]